MDEHERSPASYRKKILDSHRQLNDALGKLEKALDPMALPDTLVDLRDVVARHFELEEAKGGLYEVLLASGPEHENRITGLMDEHGTMLAEMGVLVAQARAQPCALVAVRAKAFSDRLRDHERREVKLLFEVLERDHGGSD